MRAPGLQRIPGAAAIDRVLRDVGAQRRPAVILNLVQVVVNAVPGGALFFYLQFLDPGVKGVPDPGRAGAIVVRAFLAMLIVGIPLGAGLTARALRPVTGWLGTGRLPTPEERRAVLAEPVRSAVQSLATWLSAAVLFGGLETALGYPGRRIVLIVSSVALAGFAASSLGALVTERVLRPVTARALAGHLPPGWRGIGVLPRVLLSWAFGSGVPLVSLLLAPVDQPHRTLASFAAPLAMLTGAGLLSGFLIISGAARAVSEPLQSIRQALRRVEAGDLDVEVRVDDSGEIGQVQAGINQMVAGLRQRRRVEDLFGRYVGTEVAAHALAQDLELTGARTEASVVFVDLVGSTAMAATMPPEEVVRTLNVYFTAVVGAVASEGGWVNKFEGDGALCVFGPPGGGSDHAARALRAACGIAAEVAAEAERHPGLVAAIGISSGTVVAGNIGSPERFEYTVIGDPVNEAARLTDLAKHRPTRMLASRSVVEAAGATGAGWVAAGSQILRGRPTPTHLCEPAFPVGRTHSS
ncbi:adenylate/guanylate cyclase domain-containing protein [Acidiferrimicrobium sp. IK]|uniref:adenylate/guanylate cyclase domain-containing protein n=1 Tax=Acidiferrimicrobium sp. IK TaxID=2871700 RepID=UPI0021CB935B|nr:adenylate/guanylate cyclase domain-containing protein [Acidiferrimicrobium sp. IK]MCU4183706.1 adenylate/guanylate cyclase domain-containing protein [Acidiferrimicrobium sp. IK]